MVWVPTFGAFLIWGGSEIVEQAASLRTPSPKEVPGEDFTSEVQVSDGPR